MTGWAMGLTAFLIVVGLGYTWLMYAVVKNDDEEQHRTAGNANP
jgi:hypothetical protein